MQKRIILEGERLNITVRRLCEQLIENHDQFTDSCILGLQPRGPQLAGRIHAWLEEQTGQSIPYGELDATFFRDDFRRREKPLRANTTHVPFIIEDKRVILIDDVLYTGRSVRAALDAMTAFGRPRKVELLVLINRLYSRDLPIEPTYVGSHVNTISSQKVLVEWQDEPAGHNRVSLIENA
jgi:pyrimidine operon attenuation protein / uracil phosphoribosyltransferase